MAHRSVDLFIVSTLQSIADKYKRKYCYPSQKTLLRILNGKYNLNISLRTLNRVLKELSDSGLIQRIRRHRKDRILGYVFKSTCYYVQAASHKFRFLKERLKSLTLLFYRVPKMAVNKDLKSIVYTNTVDFKVETPDFQDSRHTWQRPWLSKLPF